MKRVTILLSHFTAKIKESNGSQNDENTQFSIKVKLKSKKIQFDMLRNYSEMSTFPGSKVFFTVTYLFIINGIKILTDK